ncbi:hypothetical protein Ddc_16593 [Ditylenchus destructor]|nr:hypothetical protein Ddc_16593 [Ditylenchus destructor]
MHMTTPRKNQYKDQCDSELYESECSSPSRLNPPNPAQLSRRQAFQMFQKMRPHCCHENQDQESDSCGEVESEDHLIHRISSGSGQYRRDGSEQPMDWDGKSDNTTTSGSSGYGGKIIRKVNDSCGRQSKCGKLSAHQTPVDRVGIPNSLPVHNSSSGNGNFLLWNILVKFIVGLLGTFVEFFTQIGELAKSASGLQVRILLGLIVLAMFGAYYVLIGLYSQLGWTVTLTTGTFTDWILMGMSFAVRSVISVLRQMACGLEQFADLGESMSCDWAAYLCDHLGWMCHRRCGFTARMLERSTSRCG